MLSDVDAVQKPTLSKAARKNAKRKEKKQTEASDLDSATQSISGLRYAKQHLAAKLLGTVPTRSV